MEVAKIENPELDTFSGFGGRPILATFSILKNEIVNCFRVGGEAEIVVLPENAELVRYEFITSDKIHKTEQIEYKQDNHPAGVI